MDAYLADQLEELRMQQATFQSERQLMLGKQPKVDGLLKEKMDCLRSAAVYWKMSDIANFRHADRAAGRLPLWSVLDAEKELKEAEADYREEIRHFLAVWTRTDILQNFDGSVKHLRGLATDVMASRAHIQAMTYTEVFAAMSGKFQELTNSGPTNQLMERCSQLEEDNPSQKLWQQQTKPFR